MKKFMSICLFSLFFIFQSVLAEDAASDLEKNLGNYNAYQANFSQVNYDNKNKGGQKSQGRVYMQRPGKFRWETTNPYQQTVIANGNKLWIYDVDLKQASQQSLAKRGFNPAQLLTEPVANLTQKFTVTQENGWFKLLPNKSDRGFKSAYLRFQNNQLTGLKVINQLNQTNVFTFSNIQVNPKLSSGLFNFNPPKGVQVLQNKQK